MHLVIDGFGGDPDKLWDRELVRDFLTNYPAALGMTRLTEARVLEYQAPNPEDSGISGFVIIAESHLSVHTFPHRRHVNIDIFSCRSFDNQRALDHARDLFGLQEVRTWLLDRGLEWLDGQQALAQVRRQREDLEAGARDGGRA